MAKKQSTMQNEVEKSEQEAGEQMKLIDVGPENSKEIIKQARIYKAAVAKRIKATNEEVPAKQKLLKLIIDAHLNRLEDGTIKFKLDGYTITVTPRDELIKVKEDKEET